MEDFEFLGEGHYRHHNGTEYMSIWTYKRKKRILLNNPQLNYKEAKEMDCSNKFWGPFNASDNFKEGWMYDVEYLNEFYDR